MVETVKNSSAMQETEVPSLGGKDPLQKEMATHSRTLAWRIPWVEEPDGPQSGGGQRVRPPGATNTSTFSTNLILLPISLE